MDTQITNNLIELNHDQYIDGGETYIQELSNQWFKVIKASDPSDYDRIEKFRQIVSQLGKRIQKDFWTFNTGLKGLLERQIQDSQQIEQSTQLIQQLKSSVLKIKPPKNSFIQGFVNKFKLLFSVKHSAWEMWLESYPNHKHQINKIVKQLENMKLKLNRNYLLLTKDNKHVIFHIDLLEKNYDMIVQFEKNFSQTISINKDLSTEHQHIMLDELLPILNQRSIELHQQLLIARQAAMTLDLFINQNKSQINGIDQAIHTTTSAIEVTASIFALKQIDATINKSLTQNNKKLDTQKLKQARNTVESALKQLDRVKQKSNSSNMSEN